ncbi:MATE family efflux transporter [Ruminococcus sp.]|uniref:MATE family efflux transporter n=1 Tax=Ruminococcus sp. TaxID=41978 RepID=UPI002587ADE2|nr:MATE family efflux transporter [Ruminococcus sp.]MCR5020080.1 MATE family efflux transporter [Ruminococcus sp.]
MEKNANKFLGREPISRLMKKYAVPCIISLLVGALYNIVDQIFIANASYLGSYGNAANTVVFPLTVIALAIAVMIGDGCCAFVSLSLGKGEPDKAKKSVGNSVLMTIVSSLILCAVYLIFSDGIIAMFGGTVNEETFRHSKEYFLYISLGIPFYMFGQAMNPVIRADGSPKFDMISTLAGAVLNMIRKYSAMDSIFGQEQYAQIPMAVVGIVMKFFQIVISIVVGMAAGCIPIVGFNMGAGLKSRVRELFTKLLTAEAAVGAVALIFVEFFPRQLIGIFGAANESSYYTDFAVHAFRIYLCMMIFACVNKACFIFLQTMGKAVESTALSMIREIVFGVGFAITLPIFFGLDGVLYSMPISDILTFAVTLFLIIRTYKELSSRQTQIDIKMECRTGTR